MWIIWLCLLRSWFYDSIEVYSSFVLVQMIGCTVILAVCIFYIDLVWKKKIKNILESFQITIHSILLNAAISSHGCIYCNHFDGSLDCNFESFHLLLLWTIGYGKFWTNVKLFILQLELAEFTSQITEIHCFNDFEYAETHSLSRIWDRFTELKDLHSSKYRGKNADPII